MEKQRERCHHHRTVTSVFRSCAVLASLKTRSLFRFNHHHESSFTSSSPRSRLVSHEDVFNVGRVAAGVCHTEIFGSMKCVIIQAEPTNDKTEGCRPAGANTARVEVPPRVDSRLFRFRHPR